MQGQRLLVTGGAGFIGSNLANRLAERNNVIAIDDEFLGTPENLSSAVEYRRQSVLEEDLPTDVDAVFHIAALSSYSMHEDDPARGARVNVEGFVNTVDQARQAGCETVVYASTSSIYGSQTEPSPVDQAVTANTGYEASKLARERYAEYFHNHYGMTMAGLRLFSVYQGYGGAESHKAQFANVIAQFADDIANGRAPELYGDGTQTRDFVHVDDVVDAFERAADHRLNGVYNVGTGIAYSFNEVVELINEELGTDVDPVHVENPLPDSVYVHDTCADASTFERETDWQPTVDFETGIERVCAHYRA
ncbi:MAG: NAD-dependent epimerase/dehydratase family protein [Halobacteriota archaeon]